MRAPALAGLLMLFLPDAWAADPPAAAPAPSLRARLSDDAIKDAVRATLAEEPAAPRDKGTVLRGDRYDNFSRQFDDAKVPSCMHPDAMKHQPPQIGPIGLGGIFALPFWGAAILRGKCN